MVTPVEAPVSAAPAQISSLSRASISSFWDENRSSAAKQPSAAHIGAANSLVQSPSAQRATQPAIMLPTITPMPTITRLNRFCALARTSGVVSSSTTMKATKMKQPKHSPCSATPSRSDAGASV